jgi:hypothetical protein
MCPVLNRPLLLATVLVAACSGGSKPDPQKPELPPDPATNPEPAAAKTSAELCPKLVAKQQEAMKDEQAEWQSALMEVLEAHCPRWPVAAIECLLTADTDDESSCLDSLTEEQRTAFFEDVSARMPEPAPDCSMLAYGRGQDFVTLPADISPADRELVARINREPVRTQCDAGWNDDVRICLGDPANAARTCLEKQPGTAAELDKALVSRTALLATANGFKPTDKKIACSAVVTAHYGDKQWKDKLAGVGAKEKKKLVKASTTAMAAACKDETWSALVRGCVIAAKTTEERGWCLDSAVDFGRWAYPAESVRPATMASGMPECDKYIASVEKLLVCDKFPETARDATREGIKAMREGWATATSADARMLAEDACRTANDAMAQAAEAMGCKL